MARKKMRFRTGKGETGLSLTEVLVTTALLSIAIGSLYTLLIQGQDVFRVGGEQIEIQSNARVAFLGISKDVRQSYELVDTVSYPSPPTDSYKLSMRGLPVVKEGLTVNLSTSPQSAASSYPPWLSTAAPVVYKNGVILATNKYSVNYSAGIVTNSDTAAWTASDIIEASYTRNVYVQFYLSDTEKALKRKTVSDSGTVLEDRILTKYVVNKDQSPVVPLFSRDATNSPNLVAVTLLIDKDLNEKPSPFRLETEIYRRN